MLRLARITFIAIAAATFAGPAAATGVPLEGDRLKQAIAGKRVYLAVPLGGEFPLFYRADGQVDGSGEALGLGRYLKPTDTGRWWVDGAKLCQKWRTWYDGRAFCFTVRDIGGNRIAWARDDGTSGTARIGD